MRHSSTRISPDDVATIIGFGTVAISMFLLLIKAYGHIGVLRVWPLESMFFGLLKEVLLTTLLVTQQNLIRTSLSSTIYVFPIAVGVIAVMELVVFGANLSTGGIIAVILLFVSGITFALAGHLKRLNHRDKSRFISLVFVVVGFSACDKIGIQNFGWLEYLLFTGFGNLFSSLLLSRRIPQVPFSKYVLVSIAWVLPELFFNFAISRSLPVSYGYFAIALRVPLLMLIAAFVYNEGSMQGQLLFGVLALAGTALLFFC